MAAQLWSGASVVVVLNTVATGPMPPAASMGPTAISQCPSFRPPRTSVVALRIWAGHGKGLGRSAGHPLQKWCGEALKGTP